MGWTSRFDLGCAAPNHTTEERQKLDMLSFIIPHGARDERTREARDEQKSYHGRDWSWDDRKSLQGWFWSQRETEISVFGSTVGSLTQCRSRICTRYWAWTNVSNGWTTQRYFWFRTQIDDIGKIKITEEDLDKPTFTSHMVSSVSLARPSHWKKRLGRFNEQWQTFWRKSSCNLLLSITWFRHIFANARQIKWPCSKIFDVTVWRRRDIEPEKCEFLHKSCWICRSCRSPWPQGFETSNWRYTQTLAPE